MLCVRREGCSVCSLVPRSHCPHLHRDLGCRRIAATVIPPYSPSTILLTPPLSKLVFSHMNFALLSHSDDSCTHRNLSVIPSWSHHLGNGSNSCCGVGAAGHALCSLSLQPPAEQQYHGSPQQPAQLSLACSTGKITGRAVFFKGKL